MRILLKTALAKTFAMTFAMTLSSSPVALAAGEFAEALRCHDYVKEELGDANAATLCRGIVNANATAVYNCLAEGRARKYVSGVTAVLCQGVDYSITTATLNCFDQALEDLDAAAAAELCQRTSYAVYTSKFNCLSYALETMVPADAAKLCGGIY